MLYFMHFLPTTIPGIGIVYLCITSEFPLCHDFFFSRFVPSLQYPTSCILFRSCDTPEECGPDCEVSLLGKSDDSAAAGVRLQYNKDSCCWVTIMKLAATWGSKPQLDKHEKANCSWKSMSRLWGLFHNFEIPLLRIVWSTPKVVIENDWCKY
jgi:hypothetical protein